MPTNDTMPRATGYDEHGRPCVVELELATKQYTAPEWAALKRAEAAKGRPVSPAVQREFDALQRTVGKFLARRHRREAPATGGRPVGPAVRKAYNEFRRLVRERFGIEV